MSDAAANQSVETAPPNAVPIEPKITFVLWLTCILIIGVTFAVRVRLLDVPLERDEGEYAYAGQLILDGYAPYTLVYSMKAPLIYYAFAGVEAVFGQTARGIHLGLLVANLVSVVLVFLIGRRLRNDATGAMSAACFAALSVNGEIDGVFANSEHFVVPWMLGGILVLLRASDEDRPPLFAVSGALFAMAFLTKQPAAVFVATGAVLALAPTPTRTLAWRAAATRTLWLGAGFAMPILITAAALAYAGVFEQFWFWTVTYASKYVGIVSPAQGMVNLREAVLAMSSSMLLFWFLAAIGLVATLRDAQLRTRAPLLWSLAVTSALAVAPGLYFRSHYWVLALPAVALLAGAGTCAVVSGISAPTGRITRGTIAAILIAATAGVGMYVQRTYLFVASPDVVSRLVYGSNPFPESVEIARVLSERLTDGDRIAVLGSEPQIYFYTHRPGATSHIYMYGLMEPHEFASSMQRELISQVESARPRFIVVVGVGTSWLVRPTSDVMVLDWASRYTASHYSRMGLVEIGQDQSTYTWGEDAEIRGPRSHSWVTIYERSRD